jgi:hypothetical protein
LLENSLHNAGADAELQLGGFEHSNIVAEAGNPRGPLLYEA